MNTALCGAGSFLVADHELGRRYGIRIQIQNEDPLAAVREAGDRQKQATVGQHHGPCCTVVPDPGGGKLVIVSVQIRVEVI